MGVSTAVKKGREVKMVGSEVRIIIRRMIVCHEHKVRIVRIMVVKGVRVCSVEVASRG